MHAHMPPFTSPTGSYDSARLYRETSDIASAQDAKRDTNPTDPVSKHAHYQRGGIETIDYIRASLGPQLYEGYCVGNALKYLSRYRDKGGREDLQKASVFLGWAIDACQDRPDAPSATPAWHVEGVTTDFNIVLYPPDYHHGWVTGVPAESAYLASFGPNADIPAKTPKADARTATKHDAAILREYLTAETLREYGIGDVANFKQPPPTAPSQHPLNAAALQVEDERIAANARVQESRL